MSFRHWGAASAVALTLLVLAAAVPAAACPYSSIQVRVQESTANPWATSVSVPAGTNIHVGVFKNGWGVPVDPGTVTLYAVEGSLWTPLSLSNGWETWHTSSYAATVNYIGYCNSTQGSASATFTGSSGGQQIDVLSYILPTYPTGGNHAVITNKTNPWRTFSNPGGNVGERLPGFFITKGWVNYADPIKAWSFEQMIYDSEWIYLVRDTSWTSTCSNGNEAGMLLFTYEGGQWKRGGRHFPRYINEGQIKESGSKYVQGVEKSIDPYIPLNPLEGQWCTAMYSGWTGTSIQADLSTAEYVGGTWYNDVLKLRAVGGSGDDDEWWFAKGIGLIRFDDGNQTEWATSINWDYKIGVRIPCEPNAPCM
ncbi:MAG: hypothetical protein AAGC60_22885 [Acidobacteriota bacterium]